MKRVLFEHKHLYYLPQFIPIIEELKKIGKYHIEASLNTQVHPHEATLFQQSLQAMDISIVSGRNENERRQLLYSNKYDIIFMGNNGHIKSIANPDAFVVMVYHGIGLKQSYYRDVSDRLDLWVIESEKRYNELKTEGYKNISLCGFSKLDPLFNPGQILKSDWLNMQPIPESNKVILYAPTFYPSSLENVIPLLRWLSADYSIIIKLHHFSWHLKKYQQHYELARAVSNDCENIFLAPPDQFNIIPFYLKANVLISDISSTMFEFLAMSRPIIQTEFYKKRLKHILFPRLLNRRIDQKRFEEIDFTDRIADPKQLIPAIEEAVKNPHTLKKQRELASEKFLYKLDGNATQRIILAMDKKLKN